MTVDQQITPGLRVYVRHVRAAKLCTHDGQKWFVMRALDWNRFLEDGLSAEFLRELDDPISNRALAAAEREAASGQPEIPERRPVAELREIVRERRRRELTNGR